MWVPTKNLRAKKRGRSSEPPKLRELIASFPTIFDAVAHVYLLVGTDDQNRGGKKANIFTTLGVATKEQACLGLELSFSPLNSKDFGHALNKSITIICWIV